jgi:hypothetical protein
MSLKSGIKAKSTEGNDMSQKNHKDDESSSNETGAPKVSKNLTVLKKYISLALDELMLIFTDIKNAYKKLTEAKSTTKENNTIGELPNQAKPSAFEFFKRQINYFKMFWSFLSKKSKYFVSIVVFIIGWNLIGLYGGYSQNHTSSGKGVQSQNFSSTGKGIELVCNTYSPRHPERKVIEIDCSDREEVIDALRIAWQLVRSQNIDKMGGEDNCWKPYQSAKGTHPNLSLKDIGQTFFGQCNLPLGHVK